jgi:hypothetical protein
MKERESAVFSAVAAARKKLNLPKTRRSPSFLTLSTRLKFKIIPLMTDYSR